MREKRMAWPLAWVIIIGTLPGIFIGAVIRILYLPDPTNFKFFAGCVLLYIGLRLLHSMIKKNNLTIEKAKAVEQRFFNEKNKKVIAAGIDAKPMPAVRTVKFSFKRYSYSFYGEVFTFNTIGLLFLSFIVGIVGGTYGIGGGARRNLWYRRGGNYRAVSGCLFWFAGIHHRRRHLDGHICHLNCRGRFLCRDRAIICLYRSVHCAGPYSAPAAFWAYIAAPGCKNTFPPKS
jgi:putative Mn2+ efflux pump MntP